MLGASVRLPLIPNMALVMIAENDRALLQVLLPACAAGQPRTLTPRLARPISGTLRP